MAVVVGRQALSVPLLMVPSLKEEPGDGLAAKVQRLSALGKEVMADENVEKQEQLAELWLRGRATQCAFSRSVSKGVMSVLRAPPRAPAAQPR